ncbi:Eukaryotic translation initiation factor 5A-1 [Lunasporangiospora selenospora]|uniref:Eukaryotic translation initiation factor 5A-1 n=1 Tax=Lunasporangiospora selenospora TaxID=979761 RepID=A0A9P6FNR8_9FUNG|nr:Eukaryotic translation initiation factor 5A-1 [Lunasporangiospora selenospora]
MPRPQLARPKKGNKRVLMNSMVNIPSTNPDPYYRYKMPALEIRVNPARVRTIPPSKEPVEIPASTQIQNLIAISRALNRPIEYISKYFELELQFRGQLDDRPPRTLRIEDGGVVTASELQLVLDKFIRRFILCVVCLNPETALTVYGSYITKECGACGQITRCDRFSKLTRFLLRNREFGMGLGLVVVASTKFLKKDAQQPQGTVMSSVMGFKNGVKIATAAEIEADGDGGNEDEEEEDDDTGNDWKLDTSLEAVAQRRLAELDLITRVEKIMNAAIGDKAKDPYLTFYEFVITSKSEGPGIGELPDKDEVLGKYYTLDIEKEGAIAVLERLQKRQEEHQQQTQEDTASGQDQNQDGAKSLPQLRDDYDDIIQILRDSLEREVIVSNKVGEEEDEEETSSDDSDDSEDSEDSEDRNESDYDDGDVDPVKVEKSRVQ